MNLSIMLFPVHFTGLQTHLMQCEMMFSREVYQAKYLTINSWKEKTGLVNIFDNIMSLII